MSAAPLKPPTPSAGPGRRVPYFPFLKGVDQPDTFYFQGTLGGTLQKGIVDLPAETGRMPYAALNFLANPQSSSEYLHNVGCACKGNSMNVDNRCVGGRTETMPYAANTPFQREYTSELYNAPPYMPISQTEVATMMRAAPLPMT